jgi:hypothetical protein
MRDNLVVVETIPEYLRASHAAAGNSGVWPGNGAQRIVMDRGDAEELVEHDSQWSEILEGEDPADYGDDERCFRPTHTIVLESQDGYREEIPVRLVDGAAYTREEWDAEVPADWTYDEERGWLFLGEPCPTVFSNVQVIEQ